MFKIWVKTYCGEKLTRNHIYEGADKYDRNLFRDYVYEICNELDIPSPIVLENHISNFERFNITRFDASDYVESIDFDRFTLEYVVKPDKKRCKDLRLYP